MAYAMTSEGTVSWRRWLHGRVRRVAPRWADAAQAAWQRRHCRRLERRLGLPELTRVYLERFGPVVQHGPFAGMRYIDRAAGSVLIPKLLGSYECELHDAIGRIVKQDIRRVIDIGSAEGYFAVGLARLLPDAEIIAFEKDAHARKLCQRLAALNGVSSRIDQREACQPNHLQSHVESGTLILCDCEGYEWKLLDPLQNVGLNDAHLIVELHKTPAMSNVAGEIRRRFDSTHKVQIILCDERDPANYPELELFAPDVRALAISELRDGQQCWAVMTPVECRMNRQTHATRS